MFGIIIMQKTQEYRDIDGYRISGTRKWVTWFWAWFLAGWLAANSRLHYVQKVSPSTQTPCLVNPSESSGEVIHRKIGMLENPQRGTKMTMFLPKKHQKCGKVVVIWKYMEWYQYQSSLKFERCSKLGPWIMNNKLESRTITKCKICHINNPDLGK